MSQFDDLSSSQAYQENVAQPDQRAWACETVAIEQIVPGLAGYQCVHEGSQPRTPQASHGRARLWGAGAGRCLRVLYAQDQGGAQVTGSQILRVFFLKTAAAFGTLMMGLGMILQRLDHVQHPFSAAELVGILCASLSYAASCVAEMEGCDNG